MLESTRLVETFDIIGGIASIVGLGVSIWVLIVAQGAKEAAEEARAIARTRNLTEELDEASHKLQQVGIFLQQEEWFGIQLRIDEIAAICRTAMTRWSDHLPEERRNDVLSAVQLMRSIARLSADLSGRQPTSIEIKKLRTTHSRASELINDTLGEVRKGEERDGVHYGN